MSETVTKSRPIMFSAPMVRAILAGQKSVTRRIVKLKRPLRPGFELVIPGPMSTRAIPVCWDCKKHGVPNDTHHPQLWLTCEDIDFPYGNPGDELWVKEPLIPKDCAYGRLIAYEADGTFSMGDRHDVELPSGARHIRARSWPWKVKRLNAMYMPRVHSRIILRITDVRVERVQEITEEDAIAEGAERNTDDPAKWEPEWGYRPHCAHYPDGCDCHPLPTARDYFAALWNKINGAGSWESNPWVWRVAFEPVEVKP